MLALFPAIPYLSVHIQLHQLPTASPKSVIVHFRICFQTLHFKDTAIHSGSELSAFVLKFGTDNMYTEDEKKTNLQGTLAEGFVCPSSYWRIFHFISSVPEQ